MNRNRALLILYQDVRALFHHRGEHLARYLASRFTNLDVVSITKMYDGPGTDPAWKKAMLGLRDVIFKRVTAIRDGNVVHLIVRFPRLPGVFDYLLRDFWTYASVRKRLKRHYELCILAHPRLAFVALHLKKLGKIDVLIYDDWDYFPGEFPHDPFWKSIMGQREIISVRGADGVVSVSSGLQELRLQQGAKRTMLVPNGVDYALFRQAQVKRPHPPTLIYMGSLSEMWGVELPILALPMIRKQMPKVRYLLLGRGPDEIRLKGLAREMGLEDCVHFCGNQSYRDLPNFLAEADIGVATSRDTDFRKYACPLKVVEYMAAGLPVISTRYGQTKNMVEEAKAGETIDFDPEAFAGAALSLLSAQSTYKLYADNAAAFAQTYDWEVLLNRELEFIDHVAYLSR